MQDAVRTFHVLRSSNSEELFWGCRLVAELRRRVWSLLWPWKERIPDEAGWRGQYYEDTRQERRHTFKEPQTVARAEETGGQGEPAEAGRARLPMTLEVMVEMLSFTLKWNGKLFKSFMQIFQWSYLGFYNMTLTSVGRTYWNWTRVDTARPPGRLLRCYLVHRGGGRGARR